MPPSSSDIESRTFELHDEEEPERIVRGQIDAPPGAEANGEPLPTVLVLHGFKGFMDWGFFPLLRARLARANLVSVAFNMSGSGVGEDGESFTEEAAFERNTPTRELEDVDAIRGFLEAAALPWVDTNRLGILGHSLGGGIALLHAARQGDYRAVVTWAAVSRVDRHGAADRAAWLHDGFLPIPNARTGQTHRLGRGWLEDVEANAAELDVLAAGRALAAPTLLVHGTRDESVGIEEAEALLGALAPGAARFLAIEGGDHTFGASHPLEQAPPDLETALEATLRHLGAHLARGGRRGGGGLERRAQPSGRIVRPPEDRSSTR